MSFVPGLAYGGRSLVDWSAVRFDLERVPPTSPERERLLAIAAAYRRDAGRHFGRRRDWRVKRAEALEWRAEHIFALLD